MNFDKTQNLIIIQFRYKIDYEIDKMDFNIIISRNISS